MEGRVTGLLWQLHPEIREKEEKTMENKKKKELKLYYQNAFYRCYQDQVFIATSMKDCDHTNHIYNLGSGNLEVDKLLSVRPCENIRHRDFSKHLSVDDTEEVYRQHVFSQEEMGLSPLLPKDEFMEKAGFTKVVDGDCSYWEGGVQ